MQRARRPSHLAVPAYLETELPRGVDFDLLIIEIAQGLGKGARLGDHMAVSWTLIERGFSVQAALWLVREAQLTLAVAAV